MYLKIFTHFENLLSVKKHVTNDIMFIEQEEKVLSVMVNAEKVCLKQRKKYIVNKKDLHINTQTD